MSNAEDRALPEPSRGLPVVTKGPRAISLLGRQLPVMRLLATGLRMGAMGVRLIGLVVLARFMTPQEYGEFAFVVAFGAFAGFVIGAELYTRTIFKISNRKVRDWSPFVSRQYSAVFRILLFAWMVAGGISLFDGGGIPVWIIAIATADLLNLENNRMLVIAKNHAVTSGMLFVRQLLWLGLSFAFLINETFVNPTNAVLCAWLVAGLFSAAVSMVRLRALGLRLVWVRLSGRLMATLISASAMMLLSGLAIRGLISLDKIVLGLSDLHGVLPAYAFFAALAFAIVPVMENAVFIYLMPELVGAAAIKDWKNFVRHMRRAALLVSSIAIIYSVIMIPFSDVVLEWIGHPYYRGKLAVFYLLLAASVTYVLAMVGYYGVYALRQSRLLFLNNAIALLLCHVVYFVLWFHGVTLAMPLAMFAAMLLLLIINVRTFLRACSREGIIV